MLQAAGLLFLGIAGFRLVTDDAHDMGLMTFIIDGVAHGLAVYREALVLLSIDFVPAVEGLIQLDRVDADQHVADDPLAGNDAVPVFNTAAEARPCPFAQALCPV